MSTFVQSTYLESEFGVPTDLEAAGEQESLISRISFARLR